MMMPVLARTASRLCYSEKCKSPHVWESICCADRWLCLRATTLRWPRCRLGSGHSQRCLCATENDTVFAIDADTEESVPFKFRSRRTQNQLSCPDMGPQIGITGTPCNRSRDSHALRSRQDSQNGSQLSSLCTRLDSHPGKKKRKPSLITATLPGTGTGGSNGPRCFRCGTSIATAWSRPYERTTDRRFRIALRPRRVSRLGVQRMMPQVSKGQAFFSPLRTAATVASGRPGGRPSLIPKEISTLLPEMANSTSMMAARITETHFEATTCGK